MPNNFSDNTVLESNVLITQSGTVYLKQASTFNRYEWGGRRMRMGESTNNAGTMSVTTRQNPRGGIERDSVLQDVPGTVDFEIVMKEEHRNNMKTELLRCFFNIDRRNMCQGRDRDDPESWLQITRKCFARASTRTTPETSWEGEAEGLVTVAMQALDEFDIYQVILEEVSFGAGT